MNGPAPHGADQLRGSRIVIDGIAMIGPLDTEHDGVALVRPRIDESAYAYLGQHPVRAQCAGHTEIRIVQPAPGDRRGFRTVIGERDGHRDARRAALGIQGQVVAANVPDLHAVTGQAHGLDECPQDGAF